MLIFDGALTSFVAAVLVSVALTHPGIRLAVRLDLVDRPVNTNATNGRCR